MNSKLVLEYEFSQDGDDFGWLIAEVETPQFRGRNGMWVQWQDVGDFAALLGSYPIQADSPVTGEWGFGEQGKYTEITKVIIIPTGLTGGLLADVALANYYDPENRCRARFLTDYPSIAVFRDELEQMIQQRTGRAVLNGSSDPG